MLSAFLIRLVWVVVGLEAVFFLSVLINSVKERNRPYQDDCHAQKARPSDAIASESTEVHMASDRVGRGCARSGS